MRTKTLIMYPGRPAKSIPAKYPLVLNQLGQGESRRVRKLYLFKPQAGKHVPTRYYMDITVYRQNQPGVYYLEIKPNFGGSFPESVKISILSDRREIAPPALVPKGRNSYRTVAFSFSIGPDIERVILQLTTSGSAEIPVSLRAALRVR